MTDRDTRFAGFAQSVLDEIMSQNDGAVDASDWWKERAKLVIAQRAYDLVEHTTENTEHINLDRLSPDEHAARIPDLPVLLASPLPLPAGMTEEEAQQVFLPPVTDAQELRTYTPGQQDRWRPNTANGELGHCEYCGRSTPFTAAIVIGLPLGMICTCALEHRACERWERQHTGEVRARNKE